MNLVKRCIRICLVSFKNYLQAGQYNHLKTAVKGALILKKRTIFIQSVK
ncbi:ImpB/MucB/SamB family protein [Weissella confusa]|nr:ImpB/MucB/SamB family protein [Weissella confusa]